MTSTSTNQQTFVPSSITDFSSTAVMQQMEQVQQEVKAVLDGATIDATKLSLNFTI